MGAGAALRRACARVLGTWQDAAWNHRSGAWCKGMTCLHRWTQIPPAAVRQRLTAGRLEPQIARTTWIGLRLSESTGRRYRHGCA